MRYSVCLNDFLIYLLTVVHSFGSAEMTTLESFLNLCASISTMKFTHINSWACVSFRFVHWAHEQLHVSGRIRHFSYDSNLNAWYFLWLGNGHGHDLLIVAKTFNRNWKPHCVISISLSIASNWMIRIWSSTIPTFFQSHPMHFDEEFDIKIVVCGCGDIPIGIHLRSGSN